MDPKVGKGFPGILDYFGLFKGFWSAGAAPAFFGVDD